MRPRQSRPIAREGRRDKKIKTNWDKLRPFWIGVPHQRPAFVAYPEYSDPPDSDAGDTYFAGDHDLSGVYVVDSREEEVE